MSYETEEQQVERLKEWWSENGTPLVVGAILGLAGFGGWKYWNAQQIAYQEGASDLYLKVAEVVASDNKDGLVTAAEAVKTQFPKSSYAILSAFHIAKNAVEKGEFDKAASELTWVVDNHADNELAPVAKIRLARVLLQQGKAEEALKLVEFEETSGYYALANLVKGDALIALDKKSEALAAYEIASADLEVVARHPSLQLKMDSLAEPSVVETAEAPKQETQDSSEQSSDSDETQQPAKEEESK
ncbi:YfgM family protein [Aliikangiella marina]|uniref:YfgM family protein n=1 Tax=Aliikangiella marina TaxID=1712262 RepID=UPI00163DDA6E|nr:tetratricopeptide repeat protein [Aliikangiella marina]